MAKLFTSAIDKKLFEQYKFGNDLSKQQVVAKIFNPYGRGVWYLLNSDEQDKDYIWAIVDLFEVEVGSVSREDLSTMKVPPFGLPLERDMYFEPMNAQELYNRLRKGETFADGGRIDTMVNEWNKSKTAHSNVSNDDAEFFEKIGISPMSIGTSSSTGNDIFYYDTTIYQDEKDAKKSNFEMQSKRMELGRFAYENGGEFDMDKYYENSKKNFAKVDVIFKNPKYNYTTSINVDDEAQARDYFVGKTFDMSNGEKRENLQKAIAIKFYAKGTYEMGGSIDYKEGDIFQIENTPNKIIITKIDSQYGGYKDKELITYVHTMPLGSKNAFHLELHELPKFKRYIREGLFIPVMGKMAEGGGIDNWIGSYKKPIKTSDVLEFLNSTKNDGHKYSLWNKSVGVTYAYNGKLYANNGQVLPKGTVIDLDKVMNFWKNNNCDTLFVEDEKLVILPQKQDKYNCYTTGYDGMKNSYGNEDNVTLQEALEFCWYYDDVRKKYATKEDLEKEIKSTPYGKNNIIASTGNITGVVVYKLSTQQYADGGMAKGESFLHLYKLTYPDGKYRVDVYDGYYMSPKEALEKMRISLSGLKAYKYSGVSSDSLKYKQWYDKKNMGYSNTEAWDEVFESKMAEGGSIEQGNIDMVKNQVVQVEHHAKELMQTLKSNPQVDAWVVAKMDRATSNLSDITHYLEGEQNSFADGGELNTNEIFIVQDELKSGSKILDAYVVVDKDNPFVLQFKNRAIYCLKFRKVKDGEWNFYNVAVGFTKDEFKEIKEKSIKPTLENTGKIVGIQKEIIYELLKFELNYLIDKGYIIEPLFVDKYGVTYSIDKLDDDFYTVNESFVKRGKVLENNNSLFIYCDFGGNVFKAINEKYKTAKKEENSFADGGYMVNGGGEINGLNVFEAYYLYAKKSLKQPYREEYLRPIGIFNNEKSKAIESKLIKMGLLNSAGAINELGKIKAREINSATETRLSNVFSTYQLVDKFRKLKHFFDNYKGSKMADGGYMAKYYEVEYEINGTYYKSTYMLYPNDRIEKILPLAAKIISVKDADKMSDGGKMSEDGMMGIFNYVKIKNYPTFETEEEAKKFIKKGKPFLRKELREGKIVLVYNGKEYFLADVKGEIKMDDGGYMDDSAYNDYEEKSPSEIWDSWSDRQRIHFLSDHDLKELHPSKVLEYSFTDLPMSIRTAIKLHKIEGQYADGGVAKGGKASIFAKGGDIESYKNDLTKKVNEGDTVSTKEYASLYGISTPKAYQILSKLEELGLVCKYGYKTRSGWEDIDESNLKPNSLHWQVNRKYDKGGDIVKDIKVPNEIILKVSTEKIKQQNLPTLEVIGGIKLVDYAKKASIPPLINGDYKMRIKGGNLVMELTPKGKMSIKVKSRSIKGYLAEITKVANDTFSDYIKSRFADGGVVENKIDELYKKSNFINDDFNWKSKLLEMLQDGSIEAYNIYQLLTQTQKEAVLQELFEMDNDMGSEGDGEIETSRENLDILLEDAKGGIHYADGGSMSNKKKTTFDDKVSAIKKSLQETEVPKKYQKEYGKTYDKKESLEAAKKIAGAMRNKYKMKKGGDIETVENIDIVDFDADGDMNVDTA